jgi:hypothetical protein
MLSITKTVFCTQHVALNYVGTVKVPASSPLLLTQAFQCLYLCHHQCLCAIAGYIRYGYWIYSLHYTVHCGSLPSPISHCLNTSRSLSFRLVCTVITIISTGESKFFYKSVCGGSFTYSVTLLCSLFFLLYWQHLLCCNLFTPTSLHVVAPFCAFPNPSLCWSCWWRRKFWFPTQLFTQFLLQGLLSGFTLYWIKFIMSYPLCLAPKMIYNFVKLKKNMMSPGIAAVQLYHTELQEWYTTL